MTTLCAKIWLHKGWHAPCELPRTSIFNVLSKGYGVTYSNTKSKMKIENLAHMLIYIQDPTLTDLYNA